MQGKGASPEQINSHLFRPSFEARRYGRALAALAAAAVPQHPEPWGQLHGAHGAELFSSTTDFLFSVHHRVHIDGYLAECQ